MLTRLFGILWRRIILVLAFLPILVYAIIQTHVTAIGPLQDALWEELPGIKHVKNELGYTIPTPIPIILNFNHALTKDDLLFVQAYAGYISAHLPQWKVTSLEKYQVRSWDESWGEKMEMWSSYIPPMLSVDEHFSVETWKEEVRKNAAVYGTFVSKNFHYAVIMAGYPAGMNTLGAIRELRRVIQRRYYVKHPVFNIVGDYLDTDFVPYREEGWPEILVGSLSVTESLITWAFFVDVDIKITSGYMLLLLPFLFIVFRKAEYALVVWTATLFAFLATIATIWPLALVGMHYSVFLLPTLVGGVLIASISFNAQIMEEIKRQEGVDTYDEWQNVVVTSVRKSINYIFRLTIFCFLIFGFLYQSLWTAIVMDAVLVVGSLWAWVVQRLFLSAFYFFFVQRGWNTPKWIVGISCWFERLHERMLERKVLQNRKRVDRNPMSIYMMLLVPALVSCALALGGHIDTNSRQLEFLGTTHAKTMLQRMAALGRLDVIPVMLEDKKTEEDPLLNNEKFYSVARSFISELQQVEDVGNVASSIKQIEFEMARDDGLAVSYAEAVSLTREGAKQSRLAQWTEWKNALVIFADHPMDNAHGINSATAEIQALIEKFQAAHPWLKISLFGEMLHYPPLAMIVSANAPWVLISSLIAVFLYYSWMTRKECMHIPAFQGGFVISQAFLFVSGVVIMIMGIFEIPLNIATAAIIPVVIGAAADANVYPAQEFFSVLRQRAEIGALDAKDVAACALRTRGKAVNIDCMGNVLILSLLMLSSFNPVWHLGFLACLSLAACRWWSVNFTLPQLARLYEKHNNQTPTEVLYEKVADGINHFGYAH
ncbi:MAG: hypothetical protein G01um101429_2 [Parcubacteria group bacterium Gr01-1014_29]|nr:MAG: hypothetical protein G01um101429_2 [Parcubacteria group bacterium Gr01-1014_29]